MSKHAAYYILTYLCVAAHPHDGHLIRVVEHLVRVRVRARVRVRVRFRVRLRLRLRLRVRVSCPAT